jgi:hypothetical protein
MHWSTVQIEPFMMEGNPVIFLRLPKGNIGLFTLTMTTGPNIGV